MTRFRKGTRAELHAFVTEDNLSELRLERYFEGEWEPVEGRLRREFVELAEGVYWWITPSDQDLIKKLSDGVDGELTATCRSRLVIDLEVFDSAPNDRWVYQDRLGFFKVDGVAHQNLTV